MGAYSNGFDIDAVYTALCNRVGFRQPIGTGAPTLTSAVTTTASNRYFQDFHALVTVQNIKETMEQPNASDADLITYLTNLRKSAIMRALNAVFADYTLIEQTKLYKRRGINDTLITNTGLFCGYQIDVADSVDAGVMIDALHVYLDSVATFNIYLFKDGKVTPEWTKSVTTVANEITEVVLTDKVIGRGKWYLGYFQNDLGSSKAYLEQVEHWNKTLYFSAQAVYYSSTGATTFDREHRSYPYMPYGLNVEMSSFRDMTSSIKRKAHLFDELIGQVMAYSVLEQIVYAVRINQNANMLKDGLDKIGIQLDLNGSAPISDSPKVQGLKQRIEKQSAEVREYFYPEPKAQSVNLLACS